MTASIRTLGILAAAGGAAWLVKFGVIVATDGTIDDEGAAAFFYLAGVVLMAVGAAAVTLRLARGRGRVAAGAAALLAPALFFASFMLLDPIAQALVGDAGPGWLQDESAIALTGAAWLFTGLALRRRP